MIITRKKVVGNLEVKQTMFIDSEDVQDNKLLALVSVFMNDEKIDPETLEEIANINEVTAIKKGKKDAKDEN